jgi:phosphoglycolate phosphatase-like HAD superfamily hydrolase
MKSQAKPTGISALLLDADGVLIDTPHEAAWHAAAHRVCQWHEPSGAAQCPEGCAFSPAFYASRVAGHPRRHGAEVVLRMLGLPTAPRDILRLATIKQEIFKDKVRYGQSYIFDDVPVLLAEVKAVGLRLGVVTSSRNARGLIDRYRNTSPHLHEMFEFVVSPDGHEGEIQPTKRELVIAAFRRFGIEAAGVAYVDDSAEILQQVADLGLVRVHLDRMGLTTESGQNARTIDSLAVLMENLNATPQFGPSSMAPC